MEVEEGTKKILNLAKNLEKAHRIHVLHSSRHTRHSHQTALPNSCRIHRTERIRSIHRAGSKRRNTDFYLFVSVMRWYSNR